MKNRGHVNMPCKWDICNVYMGSRRAIWLYIYTAIIATKPRIGLERTKSEVEAAI